MLYLFYTDFIDIFDLKILQSDWPRAFWLLSLEEDFSKYEICAEI